MMHPQYILWAAAQTYQALGETQRARELLVQAHATLQERAALIPDPASRATFLTLPFNRQIVAASEALYSIAPVLFANSDAFRTRPLYHINRIR